MRHEPEGPGRGHVDGGLFTPDQFQKRADEPLAGQAPSRGVIECKKVKDDRVRTAARDQVSEYWQKNRQVLVTSCRDFLMLGQDESARDHEVESAVSL